MKRKSTFFASTGIPSLFLIFAVLCLAVLSLLTLGTTRSELNTAQFSVTQTENYYDACRKASLILEDLQESLTSCYNQSDNADTYFSLASQISSQQDTSLTYDNSSHTFSFELAFSDSQALFVEAESIYPDTVDDSFIKISQWKTDNTDSWTPDTGLAVYKGEQP